MTILDEIFAAKRLRVTAAKEMTEVGQLADSARQFRKNSEPHRFRIALTHRGRINIIGEFKRASPSKGLINGSADPAYVAHRYEEGGARAMSVLTEEDYFQGSLDDLKQARAATSLPILRKDFIFDEFQVYEAAEAGADAILLIVSYLGVDELRHLRAVAEDELSMDALVEVHTVEELHIAEDIGAKLIGVNNRNLKTFEVSLDVARELIVHARTENVMVAESGIRSRSDIEELFRLGYSGFLIGEALMQRADADDQLRRLLART